MFSQGFCLWDTLGCDISPHFGPGAEFIHSGLSGGGKVLVNCQMGVSRSSALALAYMILYRYRGSTCYFSDFKTRDFSNNLTYRPLP